MRTACKLALVALLVALIGAPMASAQGPTSRADVSPIPDLTPIPLGEPMCPDIVIDGLLGSGSPDYPSTSGDQTGRLNRNGVSSLCGAPKACAIFDPANARAFDAYAFTNDSGNPACVSVNLNVIDQANCNLQVNAYSPTYDPASICNNYLADPGLSSGIPPTPVTMSFDVNDGQDFVLVVHTTNPGEIDCNYELTVSGEICGQQMPAAEVPTVNVLGLVLLALLLLGAGTFLLLRRRMAS